MVSCWSHMAALKYLSSVLKVRYNKAKMLFHHSLATTDTVELAIFGSEVLRVLSNNTLSCLETPSGIFVH